MSHIFRNLPEIPIPEFAYVNSYDGRVFIISRDSANKRGHITIGKATSKITMHPNDRFKFLYPDLWRHYYGTKEKLLPHELRVGLYALMLSAGKQSGLYQMLEKLFGTQNANAMFDYMMFSIRDRTNSTYLIEQALADQLTFSDKLLSDSWYSNFFEKELSADKINQFKRDWLTQCTTRRCSKIWLCLDGSNNDCTVTDSDLAEPGNSKSHRAVNIYSYIWAVDADSGRPVTWFVNNGGKVDSKAFEKIFQFVANSKLQVEGVILDRGFANEDVLRLIRSKGLQYVVMLKSNAAGYQNMLEQHAQDIRWKVEHLVNEKGIFGITEKMQVFKTGSEKAQVALFFDGNIGTKKSIELIADVLKVFKEIKGKISSQGTTLGIKIPSEMKRYMSLTKTDIVLKHEQWQRDVDTKGFNAIASSLDWSTEQISRTYDLRDVSEKQFSIFKSQLGDDVTRVHDDARIQAKLAISFMAAVLRTEIELTCRDLGLGTNSMLREIDRCVITLMPNDQYIAVHDYTDRVKRLFDLFGLGAEHLDFYAEEANRRQSPIHGQRREMPPFKQPRKKPGPKPKKPVEETEGKPKRGRGRPKGSKNKKTLEREAAQAQQPQPPKRGRGRPKGSKNKKTLEKEAMANAPKRGRGRPRGSKNKKTIEREKQSQQQDKMTR